MLKSIKNKNNIIIKTDECFYVFNTNTDELKPVYNSEDIPKSFDSLEWLQAIKNLEDGYDEHITLPKEVMNKLTGIKEIPTFYFTGMSYVQQNNKIYKIIKENDKKKKYTAIDGYFKSIKINKDLLNNISETLEIIFYDNLLKEDKILKGTKQEILNELKTYICVVNLNHDEDLKKILNLLPYEFGNLDLLELNYYYSINGYFLHNNKFVDNTHLKEEFEGLELKDIKDNVVKAVNTLNEYLKVDGRPQTLAIFKYYLLTPYYYLFKQLNIQEFNKYIIAYGEAGAGKSTTVYNAGLLYGRTELDVNKAVSTVPSLRNNLNDLNTYPFVIDESTELLSKKETQELLKRNAYNIIISEKADSNNFNSNDIAKGYCTIAFTQNKAQYLFDGSNRRSLTIEYEEVPNNKEEWNKKYNGIDENTISLDVLRYIGYAFSIFVGESLQNDLLNDYKTKPNEYINSILKQIERDTGGRFNEELLNINPFEFKDKLEFNILESCIKNMSKIYWDNKNKYSNFQEFLNSSPDIRQFLKVDNDYYIILHDKFKRILWDKSNKHSIKIENYLDEIGIKIIDGNNLDNKDIYDNYLSTENSIGGVFVKTFTDEKFNKTFKGRSLYKSYLVNQKAVEIIFGFKTNIIDDVEELE